MNAIETDGLSKHYGDRGGPDDDELPRDLLLLLTPAADIDRRVGEFHRLVTFDQELIG